MSDEGPYVDTVIFDVDGVLIDTSQSFPQADLASTEFIVKLLAGGDEPITVSLSDLRAFRRAGGFNSDWDITQAISALLVAQKTNWADDPRSRWSLVDFAAEAAKAYSEGTGGISWLVGYVELECIPSDDMIHEVVDQYYWGTNLYERYFGQPHTIVPNTPGYVHDETILANHDLLDRLGTLSINKLGVITGRVGPELDSAVERFVRHFGMTFPSAATPTQSQPQPDWRMSLITNIVDLSMVKKPNPQALTHAASVVGSRGGVYVGDTRDDLRLVQNYRTMFPDIAQLQPFWSVMVASGEDADYYRDLGADVVVSSVNEVPDVISQLRNGGLFEWFE